MPRTLNQNIRTIDNDQKAHLAGTLMPYSVDHRRDARSGKEYHEVGVDGNLVTSPQPSDLPAFLKETLKKLGQVGRGGF